MLETSHANVPALILIFNNIIFVYVSLKPTGRTPKSHVKYRSYITTKIAVPSDAPSDRTLTCCIQEERLTYQSHNGASEGLQHTLQPLAQMANRLARRVSHRVTSRVTRGYFGFRLGSSDTQLQLGGRPLSDRQALGEGQPRRSLTKPCRFLHN
jgi:hypothetical protein